MSETATSLQQTANAVCVLLIGLDMGRLVLPDLQHKVVY